MSYWDTTIRDDPMDYSSESDTDSESEGDVWQTTALPDRRYDPKSGWGQEWNPATKRWKFIPPSSDFKPMESDEDDWTDEEELSCLESKRPLHAKILQLTAELAKYKAAEEEAKAKAERNQQRRERAIQRKKEIEVLQKEAEKIQKAKMNGELLGAYDKFLASINIDDAAFDKVTNEVFNLGIKIPNPPKPVQEAVQVIHNVQSLVKRKVPLV